MRGDRDLGSVEQQVLLALRRLHPTGYGVTIRQAILDRTGREYSLGSIYAALERLEGKGFVSSREGEPTPERGGRRKLHFTVTPPGVHALSQSLDALDRMRDGVDLAPKTGEAASAMVLLNGVPA
jgi:PadR family transcriptional regulator PadR